GTLEQLVGQMLKGVLACRLLFYAGKVAMSAAFLVMPYVPFRLERAQHGQYGGIGKRVAQSLAHLGNNGGAVIPQHLHDVRLAVGKRDFHGAPSIYLLWM